MLFRSFVLSFSRSLVLLVRSRARAEEAVDGAIALRRIGFAADVHEVRGSLEHPGGDFGETIRTKSYV